METLFVFIPCHTDFAGAILQAKKLRDQHTILLQKYFKLEIEISVNSYEPTVEELYDAKLLADEVTLFGLHLLYDANISQGFLKALLRKPTFFWLLSTNDEIKDTALNTIWDCFNKNENIDFIATNSMHITKNFTVTDFLHRNHFEFCWGLISGVVYKFSLFKDDFNAAPFTSWTGWEHLSVLQSSLNRNKELECCTIPSELLYSQIERSQSENREIYAHGFYGMICLLFISSQNNLESKEILRRFMFNNFFKFRFFHRASIEVGPLINNSKNYLQWNERIATSLILSSGIINYLLFKTICQFPFYLLADSRIFKWIKRHLDTRFYKKTDAF